MRTKAPGVLCPTVSVQKKTVQATVAECSTMQDRGHFPSVAHKLACTGSGLGDWCFRTVGRLGTVEPVHLPYNLSFSIYFFN
jgi:hypothetical protein